MPSWKDIFLLNAEEAGNVQGLGDPCATSVEKRDKNYLGYIELKNVWSILYFFQSIFPSKDIQFYIS